MFGCFTCKSYTVPGVAGHAADSEIVGETMAVRTESNQSALCVAPTTSTAIRDGVVDGSVNAVRAPTPTVTRLVVMVPSLDVDLTELSIHLRSLAAPRGLRILLVAQRPRPEDDWAWRRELVLLASMISAPPCISVDFHIGRSQPWIDLLRALVMEGDVVVCHREQSQDWIRGSSSLTRKIGTQLHVPTCELSGMYSASLPTSWARQALSWIVPLLIVLSFSVVQYQIQLHTTGWVTTAVMFLSVMIELVLIAL